MTRGSASLGGLRLVERVEAAQAWKVDGAESVFLRRVGRGPPDPRQLTTVLEHAGAHGSLVRLRDCGRIRSQFKASLRRIDSASGRRSGIAGMLIEVDAPGVVQVTGRPARGPATRAGSLRFDRRR